MTGVPFMHTGLLVPDLGEAMHTFNSRLGTNFTQPELSHNDDFREDGVSRPIDIRYAYSTDGPPYYELIEAHDDGLYGRQGLGLHHVGMWAADFLSTLEKFTAKGLEVEAAYYSPDRQIIAAYFKPSGLEGMRLEILDEINRQTMEDWIRGSAEPLPGVSIRDPKLGG